MKTKIDPVSRTKILDYNVKNYSYPDLTDEEIKALRLNDELIFAITPAANRLPV